MDWLEIFVETTQEGLDALGGLLLDCGLTGFIVHDPAEFHDFMIDPERNWDYMEDGLAQEQEAHPAGITFFVRDNLHGAETLAAVRAQLALAKTREGGVDLGSLEMTMKNVKEEDWANNWKKYFKPFPVGQKLYLKPSWEQLEDAQGRMVLQIDPGHIFGTGAHETTRCCMEELEIFVREKDRVLDVGCGSGILSIAALLLGAAHADDVDIDANAIDVVKENMARNGISPDRYTVTAGNILSDQALLDRFRGQAYDVVTANIVADVIIPLTQMIRQGGIYLVSGIITDREEEVKAALTANGFSLLERKQEKDWVALASRYEG